MIWKQQSISSILHRFAISLCAPYSMAQRVNLVTGPAAETQSTLGLTLALQKLNPNSPAITAATTRFRNTASISNTELIAKLKMYPNRLNLVLVDMRELPFGMHNARYWGG